MDFGDTTNIVWLAFSNGTTNGFWSYENFSLYQNMHNLAYHCLAPYQSIISAFCQSTSQPKIPVMIVSPSTDIGTGSTVPYIAIFQYLPKCTSINIFCLLEVILYWYSLHSLGTKEMYQYGKLHFKYILLYIYLTKIM